MILARNFVNCILSLTKHYIYICAHYRLKLFIYWLRPTKSCTLLVLVWVYRGVVSIGYLKFAVVVVLVLLGLPVLLDVWESSAAVSARVAVWNWLGCPRLAVEDARVAVVEEDLGELRLARPLAQAVTSVLGNVCKNVCADVPSAKCIQIPVSFNCGDLGVMVVEVIVSGSDKFVRNGVTNEDSENIVLDRVGLVLIEGDHNKSVVHEAFVGEEGSKEALKPRTSNGGRRVMTITGHIGGNEHPLWELIIGQVFIEKGGVL
jgi:hypothetical protein